MKTWIKTAAFIAAILAATSCTDSSDMLTVINKDGSCYREFTAPADSAFMVGDISGKHNPFPVRIDSTWQISYQYKDTIANYDFPLSATVYDSIVQAKDSTGFIVTIRRNYQSVDEMAKLFQLKESHSWSDKKVKYTFEKKNRWFYTYFYYKEIYPKTEYTFEIPIGEYMTEEEARFWFMGDPDFLRGMNGIEISEYVKRLDDQMAEWWRRNLWYGEYKALIVHYDSLKTPPVSKERLELLRDTIFDRSAAYFDGYDIDMEKCLNDYFKTQSFSILWDSKNSPMEKFEEDFSNQNNLKYLDDEFTYALVMPGEIVQTNSPILHDGRLVWRLTAYRLFYDDCCMEARSRKINVPAFIFSGIILVLALAAYCYRRKK